MLENLPLKSLITLIFQVIFFKKFEDINEKLKDDLERIGVSLEEYEQCLNEETEER